MNELPSVALQRLLGGIVHGMNVGVCCLAGIGAAVAAHMRGFPTYKGRAHEGGVEAAASLVHFTIVAVSRGTVDPVVRPYNAWLGSPLAHWHLVGSVTRSAYPGVTCTV